MNFSNAQITISEMSIYVLKFTAMLHTHRVFRWVGYYSDIGLLILGTPTTAAGIVV